MPEFALIDPANVPTVKQVFGNDPSADVLVAIFGHMGYDKIKRLPKTSLSLYVSEYMRAMGYQITKKP